MVLRRRAGKRVDPIAEEVDVHAAPLAYRAPVVDSLDAREQFRALLPMVPDGPLHHRLDELGRRVDAGVLAVWHTVQQAVRLESALATLDPDGVARELEQAKRQHLAGNMDEAAVEVLAARLTSAQRLSTSLDDVRERLAVLEARLGTVVARAAALALTSSASSAGLDALDDELQVLVADLDALSAGVDAVE